MLSVSPQLSDSVMAAAMAIETPALVYDLETLDQAVEDFRTDLLPVTDATLCFAVKANRAPDVLARLAAQGVGGDVATLAELHAARAASLSPIFATSPAFTEIEWRELKQAGILPDLDSRSQVARWARHPDLGRRIGLRIRLRLPDDRYDVSPFGRWSRFGVDADDPQLHQLLREHDLEVVQLHAHAGEVGSLEQADRLMETMLTCLELFPRVETLNLGGGFAPLYHKHAAGSKAWYQIGAAIKNWAALNGRRPTVVVEPGWLLAAQTGFLVTTVRASEPHPSGHRLVVTDASAWNLLAWNRPTLVGILPERQGAKSPTDLAGATCYEDDYFLRGEVLPELQVGDRLVLGGMGAYVASTVRATHGLEKPSEWAVDGDRCVPIAPYR